MARNNIFLVMGLVCFLLSPTVFAQSPSVNNEPGPSNVTASSATLCGTVTSTGAAPTFVYVFWGTNDCPTTNDVWQFTNDFGMCLSSPPVLYSKNLTGLSSNTTYYYRYLATNEYGASWALGSTNFTTAVNPDADGDGMDDDWEVTHFGSTNMGGATDDPDADGARNLDEFIANTVPTNAASVFVITGFMTTTNTPCKITWDAFTNRTYDLFWATNITLPFGLLQSDIIPSSNGLMLATDAVHMAAGSSFYSVRARRGAASTYSLNIAGYNAVRCVTNDVFTNNLAGCQLEGLKGNQIEAFFGTNQLKASSVVASADKVFLWNYGSQLFEGFGIKPANSNFYSVSNWAGSPVTNKFILPGEGCLVQRATGLNVDLDLRLFGEAPSTLTQVVQIAQNLQLLAYPYPIDVSFCELGGLTTNALRGSFGTSDEIQISTNVYWLPPEGGWRKFPENHETTDVIPAGRAFWYLRKSASPFEWTNTVPYAGAFGHNSMFITARHGFGGQISPCGLIELPVAGSTNISFSPYYGYYILDVEVNGVSVGATNSYTFTGVTNHNSLHVEFAPCVDIGNGAGPGGITSTSAWMRGSVNSFTGTWPYVTIYWGMTDGGDSQDTWQNTNSLGMKDVGAFTNLVTGLLPSTMYYYRCYGTNNNGFAWAPATTNFMTSGGAPQIDVIGSNSLVIADGDNTPMAADGTYYGAVNASVGQADRVYSISNSGSANLILSGSPIVSVSGPGDFFVFTQPAITNIPPGTSVTFTVRFDPTTDGIRTGLVAIANNVAGKDPYDFAVSGTGTGLPAIDNDGGATLVGATSAVFRGYLSSTGGLPTQVWVYRGTNDGGTNKVIWAASASCGYPPVGTMSNWFGFLAQGTKYYYRYYASNSLGDAWAPDTTNFTTSVTGTPPAIINIIPMSNFASSAQMRGQLSSTGGLPTQVYVYWGTNDGGSVFAQWQTNGALGTRMTGIVATNVTGLMPETKYYYRYFATNVAGGTWAAPSTNFTTLAGILTINNFTGASPISSNSANLTGYLASPGLTNTNAFVWIYYGLSNGDTNPVSWAANTYLGSRGMGAFSTNITGLAPGTLYFYRCFASNSSGTAWAPATTNFSTTPNWYGWAHRMRIDFNDMNNSPFSLTNFPALIMFQDNLTNFSYTQFASTNGYDLRFSDSNGMTELSYEIDTWTTSNKSLVWVKVPLLNSNSWIWAYWGNTACTTAPPSYSTNGATWSEGYAGVWHFSGAVTNSRDSSAYNNTGYGYFNVSSGVGVAGSAACFDGTDDKISMTAAPTTISPTGSFTYTLWLRADTYDTGGMSDELGDYFVDRVAPTNPRVSFKAAGAGAGYQVRYDDGSGLGGGWLSIAPGVWNHFAIRRNYPGSTFNLILNGVNSGGDYADSGSALSPPPPQLGCSATTGTNALNGAIDEFRISYVLRDYLWVWAERATVMSNEYFCGYSPVVSFTPSINNAGGASGVTSNSATLNGALASTGSISSYVYVFWGTNDAGADWTGWEHTNHFGMNVATPPVPYSTNITGLATNTTYYYRYLATNAVGPAWAPASASFTTLEDYYLSQNAGPRAGGNMLTITNMVFGNGADITNVTVGGISATIVDQSINGVTIIVPQHLPGVVDIVIYSSSEGQTILPNAYTFNPAGFIGIYGPYGWTNLGGGANNTMSNLVFDSSGNLYAGGWFTNAGGVHAKYIAMWNGSAWTNLGSGMDTWVHALACDAGGNLYAGGAFTNAGGLGVNKIAVWNGINWTNVGGGVIGSGDVNELAWHTGKLYAGGNFTNIGGVTASCVAMWNGSTWTNLGSGVNSTVIALSLDTNGNLYAGGLFTNAGGVTAKYVAKWNGSAWSSLGSGVTNWVNSLVFDAAGNLYAGGNFTNAGGIIANRIAMWNGSSWTNLGSGFNSEVKALACDSRGYVYAGGSFTNAGGIPAKFVAMWNGSTWTNLGSGMGGFAVSGLACDSNDNLYAGGTFTNAGGVLASNIARWAPAYVMPGVSPSGGTNGTIVTIMGINLCNGTLGDINYVTLCGATATVQGVSGSTQIVVQAEFNITGLGDVVVSSKEFGDTVKQNGFTYLNPPPQVSNSSGASDVTTNSATLNGMLVNNYGDPADTYIFWGTNDGGTVKAAWQTNSFTGTKGSVGPFSTNVLDLLPGTMYYYRSYASNINGEGWATESTNFTTQPGGPPPDIWFKVYGIPSPINSGDVASVTVEAWKGAGIWTDYVGTVTFLASGPASLPSDYPFQTSDNGVHTFTNEVQFDSWDPYAWVGVEDFTNASMHGEQDNIVVFSGTTNTFEKLLILGVADPVTEGETSSVSVAAIGGVFARCTNFTGLVRFISSDPIAWLPEAGASNYTFTTADAGWRTFTNDLSFKTVGEHWLRVYDDADTNKFDIEHDITVMGSVVSTSLTHFVVEINRQPDTINYETLRIEARSSSEHVVTSFVGMVGITNSDPAALYSTNAEFFAPDNGSVELNNNVLFGTPGPQSIYVWWLDNPAITGVVNDIVVQGMGPPVTQNLLLDADEIAIIGYPFDLTLTVQDSMGNIVSNYEGTVEFDCDDPGVTLLPYTFTLADNGVLVTSVVFSTRGMHEISAAEQGKPDTMEDMSIMAYVGGSVTAEYFMVQVFPDPAISNFWRDVAVVAMGNGDVVATNFTSGSCNIWSSDSDAVFRSPTLPALVNGLGFETNFVKFLTPGMQSFNCSAGTDTNVNGSASVTVLGGGRMLYVSAIDGSDSNNGLSPVTPWQTIGKAASNAVPGDVVVVQSGDYYESVNIFNGGAGSGAMISFVGDVDGDFSGKNGRPCIHSGPDRGFWGSLMENDVAIMGFEIAGDNSVGSVGIEAAGSGWIVVDNVITSCEKGISAVGAQYGVFERNEVIGGSGVGIDLDSNSDDCTLLENTIVAYDIGIRAQGATNTMIFNNRCESNTWSGIEFASQAQGVIDGNRMHANGGDGIKLQNAGTIAEITHNVIYDNTGSGILIDNAGAGSLVMNNTSVSNGMYGVKLAFTTGANVRNNIFALNYNGGIYVDTSSTNGLSQDYNCCAGNDMGNWVGDAVQAAHDIPSDPLFANVEPGNEDYHLRSSYGRLAPYGWINDGVDSPCIDAGDPGDPYFLEPESNGDRVNMGAYGNTPEASRSLVLDADGDGMPDAWEIFHFGGTNVTDGSTDFDGDSATDLDEYTANTVPTNYMSVFEIKGVVVTGGYPVVSWLSATNRLYDVEMCTNYANGIFAALATNIPGSPGSLTAYEDFSPPAIKVWYYRVRAKIGAAEATTRNICGAANLSIAANSYSLLSVPFPKFQVSEGIFDSNSGSTITDSQASWLNGEFAKGRIGAEPNGGSSFYALIMSTNNAFAGRYFFILTNSPTVLTIDSIPPEVGTDALAGARYAIIPAHRIRDIFGEPDNPVLTAGSTPLTASRILVWQGGSWSGSIYANNGGLPPGLAGHWVENNQPVDDMALAPDAAFFIHSRAPTNVSILTGGEAGPGAGATVIPQGYSLRGGNWFHPQAVGDTDLTNILAKGSSTATADLIIPWIVTNWASPVFYKNSGLPAYLVNHWAQGTNIVDSTFILDVPAGYFFRSVTNRVWLRKYELK